MRGIFKLTLIAMGVGACVMIRLVVWSYSLDRDFYGACGCSTQESVARFHQKFWVEFFVGASLVLVACLALSVILSSKLAIKSGLAALAVGVAGVFMSFMGTNLHGFTGASALTLTTTIIVSGAILLLAGGCRLGWTRLRSPSP